MLSICVTQHTKRVLRRISVPRGRIKGGKLPAGKTRVSNTVEGLASLWHDTRADHVEGWTSYAVRVLLHLLSRGLRPEQLIAMARRHNHYEAAFEDYVRSQGWPYVPVDEQKKAIFAGARIKSFDFLVYRPGEKAWLVDVKGRKFPYDFGGGKRYWENWVTREDLEGLRHWEGVFGDQFIPGLVFAYWLTGSADRDPAAEIHVFRNEYYAFLWVAASDYVAHARQRSPKWDTVTVPSRTFRRLVQPVHRA